MNLNFDEFSQEEIDQNLQAAFSMDKKLHVTFYMRSFQNNFKSAEQGRLIFEDRPFIRIFIPGDKNMNIDREVTDLDKMRFAEKWERFEKQLDEPQVGTPLKVMPWLTPSQVSELAYLNVKTVEDLANLSDGHISKFLGGNKLRDKARQFLDIAEQEKAKSALENMNESLMAEINALKDQMKKMSEQAAKAPAKG